MPVYQRLTWVCDVCAREVMVLREVTPYSNPTVTPPGNTNWTFKLVDGEVILTCPAHEESGDM